MGAVRIWGFRVLVAIAAFIIVISATMPWWICYVRAIEGSSITLKIYQYGIPESLLDSVGQSISEYGAAEFMSKIYGDITPFYQSVLAWVYLAVSVGLILYSTWLTERKGRWLLGGVGLIYVVYAIIAVVWIAVRTGDFGISLQGESIITRASTDARLGFGYYLAHAGGLMCIVLALLRNIIVGRPKISV